MSARSAALDRMNDWAEPVQILAEPKSIKSDAAHQLVHDVEGELRDWHGRWTVGGHGGGAPLAPHPPAEAVAGIRRYHELQDAAHAAHRAEPGYGEREHNLSLQAAELRTQLQEQHSREVLRRAELQAYNDTHRTELAHQLGVSPQEFDQQAVEELRRATRGNVAVRITNGNLAKVLEDGVFRTQFETQRSSALKANEIRAAYENAWFDYPMDLAPEHRPVYGYVMDGPDRPSGVGERDLMGFNTDNLASFGTTQVVLKPNVRQRTTFNVGDSLSNKAATRPSRLEDPQPESFAAYPDGRGGFNTSEGLRGANRDYSGSVFRREHFIEAQIHSPDGVSRPLTTGDISHVLFPATPSAELRAALDGKGIPWRVFTATTIAKDGSAAEKTHALKVAREDEAFIRTKIAEYQQKLERYRASGDSYSADLFAKDLLKAERALKQVQTGLEALRKAGVQ